MAKKLDLKTFTFLLKTQSFKNTAWNLAGTVTYPVMVLLCTPFFINRLGPDQYGIWMLINTTTQLMSVLNLGLGDANIKFISKYTALEDFTSIRKTVTTTFTLALIIVLLSICLGLVLAYLIQYHDWFNLPSSYKAVGVQSVRYAFILFGLKFLEVIVLSIFQGYERYDRSSMLSLLSRVIVLVANVVWVYNGASLIDVFISSVGFQLLFLFIEIYFVTRSFSYLSFSPSIKIPVIREIFGFSLWTWLQSLMAIVTTQLDKFLVVYFSDVHTLSYYSLGSMITTQLHSIFSSASGWIFPVVSKKDALNEPLKRLFFNAQTILLGLGFSAIFVFLLLEEPILKMWLGDQTYANSIEYIRLFIFYNLFLIVNIMPYYFLNGTGHVKYNTLSEFIIKIFNIGGMLLMVNFLGIQGLIWGLILSMVIALPIKASITNVYALRIKNMGWGLESIICPSLLVLCFIIDNLLIRGCIILLAAVVFFRVYLVNGSLIKVWKSHE